MTLIGDIQTALGIAESAITAAEGAISGLQSDVGTAEGNITTIQNDITGIESDITGIEGDITTINSDVDVLESFIGGMIGVVLPYAGSAAPSKWLLCYGQAISRTTYASLFTAIGTTYGAGNGSTTFNLPDMRGRTVAGKDNMGGVSADRISFLINGDTLGAAGGVDNHTLTQTEMPAHTHGIPERGSSGAVYNAARSDSAGFAGSYITSQATGSNGAHNNLQPTIILNYMIYAGV